MHYADYCHRHGVWFHAEDQVAFLKHYACERSFLDFPPMSPDDREEHGRMGHEFWKSARNEIEWSRAVGMVLEADYQRRLAEAIDLNLPPPQRQMNPWLEMIYGAFTSGEAERRS